MTPSHEIEPPRAGLDEPSGESSAGRVLALRRVDAAARFAAWWYFPVVGLMLARLVAVALGFVVAEWYFWLFLGMAAGAISTRLLLTSQARRQLRELAAPERAAALRCLERDPSPEVRQLIAPLLKERDRLGCEVTPSEVPGGTGSEALPTP